MGKESWSLIGRLRNAVKKIKFLLNFNVNRWRLASVVGTSSSKRRLSFQERRSGLIAACTDDDSPGQDSSHGGGGGGGCGGELSRTISFPSTSEDDIDKRAELFIANFYKQLRIERQVSLELRYCRGNSFDYSSPSPS